MAAYTYTYTYTYTYSPALLHKYSRCKNVIAVISQL